MKRHVDCDTCWRVADGARGARTVDLRTTVMVQASERLVLELNPFARSGADMNHDGVNPESHDCSACPIAAVGQVAGQSERDTALTDLSRRHFVSVATLSAIALTLTACGGGELGGGETLTAPSPTPTPTPSPTNPPVALNQIGVTVASYPALLAVGGIARVSNNPAVAVARTAAGFVAYSLRCPHAGTTVTAQAGNTWRCSNHGALFSANGTWTGGPQRTTNLVSRGVTANANNTFIVVNLT